MDEDERFKHLATDPKFRKLRKKQRKVVIDDRFKGMFTDEKFTLKYSKDKRGRPQKKTTGDDLKRFYALDDGKKDHRKKDDVKEKVDEKDDEDNDDEEENVEDEDVVSEDDEASSPSSSSEELSSSSDEPETDDDEGDNEIFIRYDWQPLDHDAEHTETTTDRLAIQNLDWDRINAKDIYILVNSIRPPLSVKVYVSEYGRERLAREEKEGPPEFVDLPKEDEDEEECRELEEKMVALKNPQRSAKINEYEDADEALNSKDEKLRERIRQYQLNRMKYFYAIVNFDSKESAEAVCKELDGVEYEGSSLELDLRYVPEGMSFDPADMRQECDKLPDPATYKAPQFINSALQQTTVKFTWDETDTKRQQHLNKAFTKEELEKDDLDAYLATDSDSGDEQQKYKDLLQSLAEEEAKKKKVDIDVEWSALDDEQSSYDNDDDSEGDDECEGDDELREDDRSEQDGESDRDEAAEGGDNDEDLDLMLSEPQNDQPFKFNPDDERFKAVYESGLFNIDPSNPKYKRTDAFEQIAERKRKKSRR